MIPLDELDTVVGQRRALAAGRVRAVDLVMRSLERAAEWSTLNALVTSTPDKALSAAERTDAGGGGALAGVPFAHKDLFCTRGTRTTCGSMMLAGFVPPYDATVVERVAAAGGACIGKANMDEFAMGSSNENSHFGPVANPWARDRVPGGSSGGSAALVAAGVVPFATGTDTGGSVRQPAALCGVTGLKPTYGRVSRYGMVAFASSLDQAGILAHSAEDCAHVLAVIAGHDARDATCSAAPVDDYVGALSGNVRGLRVGVCAEYFGAGIDAPVARTVREALATIERLGATLVDVSLPSLPGSIPAYYVIAPAEASSNLGRYDGVRFGHRCAAPRDLADLYSRTRAEGFGAEVKRRILAGTYVLSAGYYDAYYRRAQQVRRLIAEDFAQVFAGVDVIVGPTTPGAAFRLGEKASDPLAMYAADVNTVAVNLAGLPAMSLPAGFVGGLPIGLQLIGPAFQESRLLMVANAFQQATAWHRHLPRVTP